MSVKSQPFHQERLTLLEACISESLQGSIPMQVSKLCVSERTTGFKLMCIATWPVGSETGGRKVPIFAVQGPIAMQLTALVDGESPVIRSTIIHIIHPPPLDDPHDLSQANDFWVASAIFSLSLLASLHISFIFFIALFTSSGSAVCSSIMLRNFFCCFARAAVIAR